MKHEAGLRQVELGGDRVVRGDESFRQQLRLRRLDVPREIVEQTGELHRPADLTVQDLGADAAFTDD
jgi:hypothetical protein